MPPEIKDFLLAAITPTRRLAVIPFAIWFALNLLFRGLVHIQLMLHGDELAGLWMVLNLLFMWTQFCIIANRFHDGGMSAMWVAPIYAMHAFAYLYEIDPSVLSTDESVQDAWSERLYWINRLTRFAACTILGLCIKVSSEIGKNDYGLPFGAVDTPISGYVVGGAAASKQEMRRRRKIAEDFPEYVHPSIIAAMETKPAPAAASRHAGVQRIQGRMNSTHAPAVARLHVASAPRPARSGFGRR